MTAPTEQLDRWRRGEEHLGTALGRLTDEEFDGPSLLPGWTRAQVLAHVAHGADALAAHLTEARTGVAQQVADDLAGLPPAELRAAVLAATQRLAETVRAVPDDVWSAQVRTGEGHVVPAADLPWLRAREVWVHAIDLDAGIGFADVPDDVLAAVVDDVFRQWDARDTVPDVALFAGDREWGTGALAVAGTLPAVTAWITGRSDGAGLQADGPLPTLAPWL
ncbi:maleylpyruvate isomerase family mycothiol-dependent enzyme [Modestobacter sp. SSW1-42]|uniref:maleylpyruvate isomerase family mycothiol-dependent enzyme n=1 Tax=Modestobacter sp. SSW1-42 TaxID=596372 RepID=UPI003985A6F8